MEKLVKTLNTIYVCMHIIVWCVSCLILLYPFVLKSASVECVRVFSYIRRYLCVTPLSLVSSVVMHKEKITFKNEVQPKIITVKPTGECNALGHYQSVWKITQ